jgi:hypothetical protein
MLEMMIGNAEPEGEKRWHVVEISHLGGMLVVYLHSARLS